MPSSAHENPTEALDADAAIIKGQRVFTRNQIHRVRMEIFYVGTFVFVACALLVFLGYRRTITESLNFCASLSPDYVGTVGYLPSSYASYGWLLPLAFCCYLYSVLKRL